MADDDLIIRAAIRDELSGPLENIRERVERLGDEAVRSGRKASLASRGFDRLGRAARNMGALIGRGLASAARYGAIGLGVLTAAAGYASFKLIGLASDAAEIESAFRTVFGKTAKQVDAWVGRMNKQFGIATHELRQAASTFGIFGKAAGVPRAELAKFSTSLAQAGLDLASFYNAEPGEVFLALRSGLAGEAEPLRKFGIFLSDAAMQAQAAEMGLTGELTEQQKVMVRQKLILAGLGDAQGDMARTSEGWANQMRGLKGRLTDAGVAIGTLLKDALLPMAQNINQRLAPGIDRLNRFTVAYTAAAADAGHGSAEAAESFDILDGGTGRLRRRYLQLTDVVRGFQRGGLMGAIKAADRTTKSQGRLTSAFRTARGILRDVGTVLTDILWPAFKDVTAALPLFLSPLKLVRAGLGWAADNAEDLAPLVTALVGAFTAAKLAMMGYAAWQTIVSIRNAILMAGFGGLTAAEAAATGATWSLNTALMANPVGLVVAAIALLVGGLILLYKKSETARDIMNGAFSAIATVVGFVAKGIISYWQFVVDMVLGGIQKLLEGIAWLDEKVGGKIPGDFRGAAEAVGRFRDTANRGFDSVKGKVDDLVKGVKAIGEQDPKVTITVDAKTSARAERAFHQVRRSGAQTDRGVPEWKLMGDTAHSRATGSTAEALSATLAAHARYTGTGSGIRITNALTGGGGRGRGSGDHQAGRALDLVGPGLNAYASRVRADGGYAAFHGSGPTRHLHTVPAGDTPTTRRRAGESPPLTVNVAPGAIVVQESRNPGATARAVREQLAAAVRDAAERSYD